MRKAIVAFALTAASAVVLGFAPPPDSVVRGNAAYARRGSLGANDYVVTKVAPCKSAYRISAVVDGQLRDRAMNVATVTNDTAFALPARRLVAGFARSFCVSVTVASESPCRISFTGAGRIFVSDAFEGLALSPGRHIVSFMEIGDNEYAVDVNGLSEAEGGR